MLLSTLCLDVQKLHVQHHPDYFKMPSSPDFAVAFFDTLLAEDTTFIFIVEDNGEALGYVFCKSADRPENPFLFAYRYLVVDQISVRPNVQGKGVGRKLMQQVELTARELGIDEIHLSSWAFNTHAHGFFERMGYQKHLFKFWKNVD